MARPARAPRPKAPKPALRERVTVTWAEEDDPATVDRAVAFLRALLDESVKR